MVSEIKRKLTVRLHAGEKKINMMTSNRDDLMKRPIGRGPKLPQLITYVAYKNKLYEKLIQSIYASFVFIYLNLFVSVQDYYRLYLCRSTAYLSISDSSYQVMSHFHCLVFFVSFCL